MTAAQEVTSPVLVTGATGTIGWHIVDQLVGHSEVRALVRDPARALGKLPAGVDVVEGDLTDPLSISRALVGVQTVFHAAGMPEQWVADPSAFHRANAQGTRSLARAALDAGVSGFVYTSTIDVLHKEHGIPFNESQLEQSPLDTAYQRSKQDADRVVVEAIAAGLPARFLHPSALFGPSPSATPGPNDLLVSLAGNKLPLLPPGGMPMVFAPDVAAGHILAATAPVGARYILSDRYLTLTELADGVAELVPTAKRPRVMPKLVAHSLSLATEGVSKLTGQPPMLPAGQLHFLTSHVLPDSTRARTELGWTTTPLSSAVAATLRSRGVEL